jgi:hypothetical protein
MAITPSRPEAHDPLKGAPMGIGSWRSRASRVIESIVMAALYSVERILALL